MPVLDMDSISSFEVYPKGTYRAHVTGWEWGKSSNKGTKQIRIKTMLEVGSKKKPYTEFINITDNSVWKIGKFIVSCGVKMSGKMDTSSPLFSNVLDALMGKTLFITLDRDEQYNNNKSESYARDDQQPDEEFMPVDDAPESVR